MSEDKKITISEYELRQLCKEEFMNNVKDNMDSSIIFAYVRGLEKGIIKYKEVLDKIKERIKTYPHISYASVEKIDGKRLSGQLIPVTEILELLEEIE